MIHLLVYEIGSRSFLYSSEHPESMRKVIIKTEKIFIEKYLKILKNLYLYMKNILVVVYFAQSTLK